jgi:oligopeptide/dipeptide ABC transporter ATP-binding protein
MYDAYPHQVSGGQKQRVMIAMAMSCDPSVLIADEPTTALDVTVQAQIMELLASLQEQFGMAILLITHNLGIVGDIADEVAVMYAGQLVERGPAKDVLRKPLHPYTQALLNSVPRLDGTDSRLRAIPGNVPQLGAFPPGCRFHPRCPRAQSSCSSVISELVEVSPARWLRCPVVGASPDSALSNRIASLPA